MQFIVFEGLDGSGKTTQVSRLKDYFLQRGVICLCTREPSDSAIGGMARDAVRGRAPLSPDTLALLFAADRAEHMVKEIKPALEKGMVVICDRFVYSNLAYQGTAIPMQDIVDYNKAALNSRSPDVTFFIDTTPEECTRRIIASRAGMDIFDGIDYAEKIRTQYLQAFSRFEQQMPVVRIDGNNSPDEVFDHIITEMEFMQIKSIPM